MPVKGHPSGTSEAWRRPPNHSPFYPLTTPRVRPPHRLQEPRVLGRKKLALAGGEAGEHEGLPARELDGEGGEAIELGLTASASPRAASTSRSGHCADRAEATASHGTLQPEQVRSASSSPSRMAVSTSCSYHPSSAPTAGGR